ncbi:MAG: hypothetical protein HY819_03325 [Acidobacteria bacterium]|nr:hypothetical protein [Acidobacteriota bacterium]
MEEQTLQSVIDNVKLPIELPEEGFIQYGNKHRLVDFWLMIKALPKELRQCVDRDSTITNISQETFALPLKSGSYVFVRLKGTYIVRLELSEQARN